MKKIATCFLSLSLLTSACATSTSGSPSGAPSGADQPAGDATTDKIKSALAGTHRSAENAARDKYRHPLETLTFFGLRDDMTVVELSPGTGWYTEVLAPVLKDRGRLVVTAADPKGDPKDYNVKRANEILALKETHPEQLGKVELVTIDPPENMVYGPAGSADMVVSFRSVHGWMRSNQFEAVVQNVAAVLKSGGIFGLVSHRGTPAHDPKSGYVDEALTIKVVEAAGLKLVDKSEVNANPKDTKDYPEGVWTLPPTFKLGDQDREKYAAIGESDRFTLKFVKP